MLTILLADDNEILRRRVRAAFEDAGWTVVGEAENGLEAIEKTGKLKPELVLLNVSMPRLNGFQALPKLLEFTPAPKVLIFTLHDGEVIRQRASQLGAHGFFVKSQPLADLIREANKIVAGKS